MSNQVLPVEEIRRAFEEDRDTALKSLKIRLEQNPEDIEAMLLKVELTLQYELIRYYKFAGEVLSRPDVPEKFADTLEQLCHQRDQLVQQQLERGRAKLADDGNGADANGLFDLALALTPTDAAIAFTAAKAMFEWKAEGHSARGNSRFGRKSNADHRNEQLPHYARRAITLSQPGETIYNLSAYYLAHHALETKIISSEHLDLLLPVPDPDEAVQDLWEQLRGHVVTRAFQRAALLLQIGLLPKAGGLFTLIHQIAPQTTGLQLTIAEKYRIEAQPQKAMAAYKKCLRPGRKRKVAPNTLVCKLQHRLEEQWITCATCGKKHPLALKCSTCDADWKQHDLLTDRYPIQWDNSPALAHIGLAELYTQMGDAQTALSHLDSAQELLHNNHDATLKIKLLRSGLGQEDDSGSPVDRILTMLAREGVTHGVLYHITRLNETAPETWLTVPVATRLKVCRALLNAGQLLAAQRLFIVVFADNPERKSARQFAQMLQQQITVEVAARKETVHTALAENRAEDIIPVITQALMLLPDDAELYLLRGHARTLIGHDAPALEDLYTALDLATDTIMQRTIRLKLALLLERRWDLEGAGILLDALSDDDEIQQIRARLERRRTAQPYIHVERAAMVLAEDSLMPLDAAGYYDGYFAIVIREVSRPNHLSQGWNDRLLNAGFEFTQILGTFRDIAVDVAFGLRIICNPYPVIPERGKITMALLARVTAQDIDECHHQAQQVYNDIVSILPLGQENIYIFEPVVDGGELQTLRLPFTPQVMAEIVRRETDPEHDGIYTVAPFTPGTMDMHSLLWTLLRQPVPSMVSIHLKPTHLYAWDRQVETHAPMLQNVLAPTSEYDTDAAEYLLEARHNGQRYVEHHQNHHLRLDYLRYAFILRVNVVGSAGTSSILPHMAAATFMGPLRDHAKNGGYEIMQAFNRDDWQAALHNLQSVDVAHWGYSAVPENQRKLRYAVGEGEAAHMFRLPIPTQSGVPGMQVMEGRSVPPPAGMSATGTMLGVSTARGANAMPVKVVINDLDRRRHVYAVGKTGTGKSTLLAGMVIQDIIAGKTVCLLDPHGDLVQEVMVRIPKYRMDDVVLIDPSDEEMPVGLNVLNPETPDDMPKIANAFLALLQRLYDPHNQGVTGPIFQSFTRNALLAVMHMPGGSLLDVYRILADIKRIKSVLPHITDPVVKSFWEDELKRSESYGSSWRSELIPYLISKFSRFVEDPVLRRIVGQPRNTVNWFDAVQSNKIILLNLAKGRIGAETSQFLGLLILEEVMQAVLRRTQLPQGQRRDVSIVIDEVQNYSTPLLSTIISEGRKFGVSLTIANQFLHQLDNGLREAVFGNVGTIAAMRVGVDDAALLAREFYPVFSADDLTNLPQFTAATKLLVNGLAARPFTMRTLLPTQKPDHAQTKNIRQLSQQRYGTPIAVVETEIAKRFRD